MGFQVDNLDKINSYIYIHILFIVSGVIAINASVTTIYSLVVARSKKGLRSKPRTGRRRVIEEIFTAVIVVASS